MSNEWELQVVYQQMFKVGRKFFSGKSVLYWVSFLMYGTWWRVEMGGWYGLLIALKSWLYNHFTSEERKMENKFL